MRTWTYRDDALYFGGELVAGLEWNISPFTDSWDDGTDGVGQFIVDALNAAEQPKCQIDGCKEDPRQCGSGSCMMRADQRFAEGALAAVRRMNDEPSERGKAVLRDLGELQEWEVVDGSGTVLAAFVIRPGEGIPMMAGTTLRRRENS